MAVFAQILNNATATTRGAGDAGIAPVQDQPVVGILFELIRHLLAPSHNGE